MGKRKGGERTRRIGRRNEVKNDPIHYIIYTVDSG